MYIVLAVDGNGSGNEVTGMRENSTPLLSIKHQYTNFVSLIRHGKGRRQVEESGLDNRPKQSQVDEGHEGSKMWVTVRSPSPLTALPLPFSEKNSF